MWSNARTRPPDIGAYTPAIYNVTKVRDTTCDIYSTEISQADAAFTFSPPHKASTQTHSHCYLKRPNSRASSRKQSEVVLIVSSATVPDWSRGERVATSHLPTVLQAQCPEGIPFKNGCSGSFLIGQQFTSVAGTIRRVQERGGGLNSRFARALRRRDLRITRSIVGTA